MIECVDGPWFVILQRCLKKLWEMFHEKNYGRLIDIEAYKRELAKLKNQNEFLFNQYSDLVADVGKLFEWQDEK